MKLLFCALAGPKFGYGHLNRCLSIAEFARKQGLVTAFHVLGQGADTLRKRGYTATETAWPGILSSIPVVGDAARTVVIIDVAHPSIFSRLSELGTLLQMLRKLGHKLVAIDSLGDYSFATALPMIPVDAIVAPYVGAEIIPGTPAVMLVGPKYAVLSTDYADMPVRRIKKTAGRILVTFGGSDPQALTLVVLAALALIKRKLHVRVVIGPLFSARMTAQIETQTANLYHDVELLPAPNGLVEHMQWADIAVASSGLVKYELAATGTPGILVSIDEAHDLANRSFSQQHLQRDLGVTSDASVVSEAIEELLDSPTERCAMAKRGQRLIDGKGVERLIAAVQSAAERHH